MLKDYILPIWYVHAFNRKSLYVILQGKHFKTAKYKNKTWDEMTKYDVTNAKVEGIFLNAYVAYIIDFLRNSIKDYICKIATIDEMEVKWNYEIKKQRL